MLWKIYFYDLLISTKSWLYYALRLTIETISWMDTYGYLLLIVRIPYQVYLVNKIVCGEIYYVLTLYDYMLTFYSYMRRSFLQRMSCQCHNDIIACCLCPSSPLPRLKSYFYIYSLSLPFIFKLPALRVVCWNFLMGGYFYNFIELDKTSNMAKSRL